MDIKNTFDSLKDRAVDLAQAGMAQSKRLAEIARLKMDNMSQQDAIKKAYVEIGKLYYAERGLSPDGAYAAACERVTAARAAIESNKTRIDELKKVVPIKRSHKAAQGDKSLTVDIDLMIVGGIVEDGVEPTK